MAKLYGNTAALGVGRLSRWSVVYTEMPGVTCSARHNTDTGLDSPVCLHIVCVCVHMYMCAECVHVHMYW